MSIVKTHFDQSDLKNLVRKQNTIKGKSKNSSLITLVNTRRPKDPTGNKSNIRNLKLLSLNTRNLDFVDKYEY